MIKTQSPQMQELLTKLYNHATLVERGVDTLSALRATFGEDVVKETNHLEKEINQLHNQINN